MVYIETPSKYTMIHYLVLFYTFFTNTFLFAQLAVVALINLFLKNVISKNLYFKYPVFKEILLRPYSHEFGMPSGHMQVYWAYIVSLARNNKINNYTIAAASLYGYLVGKERIENNKHTLIQLITGMFIGSFLGLFIIH